MQKGRHWQTSWQKQGWKRTPVECFKGHLEGNSTWNWPQSLNKLKTTVTCPESSRRKDLPFEQGNTGPVMATLSTAVATTKSTMFDAQPEYVFNEVLSDTTPNEPWRFPNENIWLWVKQAVCRNGLEAENMAGTRLVTTFLLQKV